MELLESLLVNKKNFIILASIYILIVIGIFIWIWWPNTEPDAAKYEPYDETEKNKEMVEYYSQIVESIKQYNDVESLEYYFSNNYLEYNNTSLAGVMYTLKSTAGSYTLETYDMYENGDKNIYSIAIPSGNSSLQVNFVEKNYPYNFYITYGTFVDYSEYTYTGILEKAEIQVTSTYQDLNYIEYKLLIENEDYDDLVLNFTNSDNIYLTLNDGTSVKLNLVKSTQDRLVVKKESTVVATLVFDVGISKQSEISTLNINKITGDSSNLSTVITF